MIGKILYHLLGNTGEDLAAEDTYEEIMELEEEGWVIVNLPDNEALSVPDVDPLENLLIEHPSMSVYQMRCRMSGAEDEELVSDEDEEDTSRPVTVRRNVSWRLAAWGIPLPCHIQLLALQRARTQAERTKLSRSALHRQNLAKMRFSPGEKRYGHFKQPCQRLYNY
ncbi:tumor protein p53-inducible nuclear protein 2 [Mugil cephalus]|uniref:tumor protein p53-inducible nuclear protein 2 n=1 Tax=Mugil cephalus TaxID=48193 RepID=UPI001FB5D9B0|nr:tumor protein p53-inducible nuclear protein 2 [Mugil cephalus]XP_047435710.1 tumor protein p53-inducible nuclear protein 2 [Mugil cephalus]